MPIMYSGDPKYGKAEIRRFEQKRTYIKTTPMRLTNKELLEIRESLSNGQFWDWEWIFSLINEVIENRKLTTPAATKKEG